MRTRGSILDHERKRDAAIRAPLGDGMVRRADTRVIERPGWYQVITPSAPGTLHNEVLFSQLESSDADRVIDETIASYRTTGHPLKWCVGPWTLPADFGERLERRGFSSWQTRGMGCDTTLAISSGDVAVREVRSETEVDAYVELALRGWSIPETEIAPEKITYRAAFARAPRVVHLFIARMDGRDAGTAGVVLREDYGYLVGTQVSVDARGRGVYKALLAARLAFLRARGLQYAVTHGAKRPPRRFWSTSASRRCSRGAAMFSTRCDPHDACTLAPGNEIRCCSGVDGKGRLPLCMVSAFAASACGAPPHVLEPRAPPSHDMPAIALPAAPPAPGAARVVLDTLDGPMRVSVQSDPTFVPPGSARAPSRVGELCVTPCVTDLPAGRYRLFLAPTLVNARGDTDDIIFGEGLNVYRRAPGKYETPSIGNVVLPSILIVGGFVLATIGMVMLVSAQGPNASVNQAIGGVMMGGGLAASIGGAFWFYDASRATQQQGATTAWQIP